MQDQAKTWSCERPVSKTNLGDVLLLPEGYLVRRLFGVLSFGPKLESLQSLLERYSRKEVIQPHLPIRLPCYDFVPIIGPTFGACFLAVSPATSGKTNFRGVTGGVCKARERIHRSIADLRLLAIPTSWSRVADSNPN